MNMPIDVFPIFTGIGSPEMALRNRNIPYNVVGISEVDKYALYAYDAIHCQDRDIDVPNNDEILDMIDNRNIAYDFYTGESNTPRRDYRLEQLYKAHIRTGNFGDIRRINPSNLPDFDLMTYGFPCKDISIAGDQGGLSQNGNNQSSLLWECKEIIEEKRPDYLLMENVKNLVSKNHHDDFQQWVNYLSSLGYNSYYKVLNGWDFGVPQNRERVIKVSKHRSHDNSDFEFPEPKSLDRSVRDIMIDESDVQDRLFYDKDRYDHITNSNYMDDVELNGPKNLYVVGNVDEKTHFNTRVYLADGSSPSLNTMRGGNRQPNILIDDYVRRLEPIECWRLMGYSDDDFYKAKNDGGLSDSRLYERAGRGIVIPMLEDIFEKLFGDMNE
jgi:DNA (cytosine-5)-methyltransferase 1